MNYLFSQDRRPGRLCQGTIAGALSPPIPQDVPLPGFSYIYLGGQNGTRTASVAGRQWLGEVEPERPEGVRLGDEALTTERLRFGLGVCGEPPCFNFPSRLPWR